MKLELYLKTNGITAYEFAKKLPDIHITTIYKWLQGQRSGYKYAKEVQAITNGDVTIIDMMT
jgi:hypothetical protein